MHRTYYPMHSLFPCVFAQFVFQVPQIQVSCKHCLCVRWRLLWAPASHTKDRQQFELLDVVAAINVLVTDRLCRCSRLVSASFSSGSEEGTHLTSSSSESSITSTSSPCEFTLAFEGSDMEPGDLLFPLFFSEFELSSFLFFRGRSGLFKAVFKFSSSSRMTFLT